MTSRRTRSTRQYEDDDEFSSQDERYRSREQRRRTRNSDEEGDRNHSRNRSRRYGQSEDEQEHENEEYERSEKEKEKETESSKTRGHSYEDDVSDDESSKRRRRGRTNEDDEGRRQSRNTRVNYSTDEEDEQQSSRSNRRSTRSAEKYSDDGNDDEEHTRRTRRSRRPEYSDDNDQEENSSRRRSRRRNKEEEEDRGEESPADNDQNENPFNKYKDTSEETETKQEQKPPSLKQKPEKKKKEVPFSKANLKKSFSKEDATENNKVIKQQDEEKKKRRRDKDASSAILDVINWKLTETEKYEGSAVAPAVAIDDVTPKPDKQQTKPTKVQNKPAKEKKVDGDTDKPTTPVPKRKLKDNPFNNDRKKTASKLKSIDDPSDEKASPVPKRKLKDNPFDKYDKTKKGKGKSETVKKSDGDSDESSDKGKIDNPFDKYSKTKECSENEDENAQLKSYSEEEEEEIKNKQIDKSERTKSIEKIDDEENQQELSDSEEETKENPFQKYHSDKKDDQAIDEKKNEEERDSMDEINNSEQYAGDDENEDFQNENEQPFQNPFQKYESPRESFDIEKEEKPSPSKSSVHADIKKVPDTKQNGHVEPNKIENIRSGLTNGSHKIVDDKPVTDSQLRDSLNYLNALPDISNISKTNTLSNLMDTYLNSDYLIGRTKPTSLEKPELKIDTSSIEKMEELEENLKSIRQKHKKQPIPPPTRSKPPKSNRSWEDPREQQRQKNKEKSWPPKEAPKDIGAYIVESYGQTDPYSKSLIKDIQRSKREELEKKEAEKRSEIVSESTKPVSTLRSTFTYQPKKSRPGVQKPEPNVNEERSWIKHEKKPVVFDKPPDEPDWMTLIRNRRWKSTVKARFPCVSTDKTDFERRSTTPKNWKRLAKDKNALRMLSEIVGVGAEGEELFMRLASRRQKMDDEEEDLDKLREEELMAYEVARETLGEDAAYSLQMDNPLPAARMRRVLNSTSTASKGEDSDGEIMESLLKDMSSSTGSTSSYPFTTSQLEAAYLTNQLLRLHPEEFRKLMSLERSRQATLRWQFSADPFDSVHEHQSLPLEIAMLASQEPRVQQAMRKIISQANDNDSVFGSTSVPGKGRQRVSRVRSDGGYSNCYYGGSESDLDGYESSHSRSSSSSIGGTAGGATRGRPMKKKLKVPPPVKPRGRSVSPSMLRRQDSSENYAYGPMLTVPGSNPRTSNAQEEEDREVHAHGLLTDEELALSEEIEKLQKLTSNIGRDIDEELKGIETSIADRKKGFYEDQLSRDRVEKTNAKEIIDTDEISSRRKDFIDLDHKTSITPDVRDELPETRHKVRRINSSAQLDAVFGGRRQISDSDTEDNDADDKPEPVKATEEMSNLVKDINNSFGNK